MIGNTNRPVLIAHRGGAAEAPENTLASFRHAIGLGCKLVELDVQMTSDGELVVIHDESVDRTTNGHGAVQSMSFAELRTLDAGVKFSESFRGEKIPTLREVLELCTDTGVGVVVELKATDLNPGIDEKVVALIGEMWLRGAENIWCISFYHDTIRRIRALDSTLPLGYLYMPDVQDFSEADDIVQAVCPYYRSALAHPEQVDAAHKSGKFVFVYTVNSQDEMNMLAEIGVDGLVSDTPSTLMTQDK
ncbi:MAG: glycerophosphodiester phosphodiesterase [Chloroflexota bacterium]|nr:glycerophosphodiester phosphodiesterase [Chloroflexota bacterium]